MPIDSIADLPLAASLELVGRHFDLSAIADTLIDQASVVDYYRQSDRGYRLFHSRDGAMHVALNRDATFTTDGYLGQVDLVAERLSEAGAAEVLEIGCGVGYNLRNLGGRLPQCRFWGVDLAENHIRRARSEAGQAANVEFETGDFERLRFPAASFDAVFAVECLCQAVDLPRSLGEICRVLRPGGRLLVIDCFRGEALDRHEKDLRLAVQLVEKTMAVNAFPVVSRWVQDASAVGLLVREQTNLSAEISHNLARFYSLSRRFFNMPRAARAFLKAFPPRLLQNAISGLLMPYTVGSGAHQYYFFDMERSGAKKPN